MMKWYHFRRFIKKQFFYPAGHSNIRRTLFFINKRNLLIGTSVVCGMIGANKILENPFGKNLVLPSLLAVSNTNDSTDSSKSRNLNYIADAVEIAAPAVVHIEVMLNDRNGIHRGSAASSNGSGFIVTEDGMILTNQHVVNKTTYVNVKLSSGEIYKGMVIDSDDEKDLAAVKIINKNNVKFPYIKLADSSKVRPGEFVAALGSPLRLMNTVTAGIVSSLHRPSGELGMEKDMVYIQTDAAINIGNSGGPLINLDGEVIGINCITVHQASGISFAIPSDAARDFLNEAITKEKYLKEHGGDIPFRNRRKDKFYIGISMLTLTPEIMEDLQQRNSKFFGNISSGVFIARVNPGSPAERAGLVRGDIIIGMNESKIDKSKDIHNEVKKGETIVFKVLRNGNIMYLSIEPEIASRL